MVKSKIFCYNNCGLAFKTGSPYASLLYCTIQDRQRCCISKYQIDNISTDVQKCQARKWRLIFTLSPINPTATQGLTVKMPDSNPGYRYISKVFTKFRFGLLIASFVSSLANDYVKLTISFEHNYTVMYNAFFWMYDSC